MTTDAEVVRLPSAERIGQATAVEQQRAIAEVQAAVVVAQQVPRDVARATAGMREACQQPGLAERAFFRYNRAGSQITGPTISLARELGRIWGNVQWGINELRRDDDFGQSEMQAWAWDVQTNTRSSTTFIVPHARDTKTGRKDLTELRDIYENNANNGARRVREMIFAVLPTWFVDEAKDRCAETLRNPGDGRTLAQRVASAVEAFAVQYGIDQARLAEKVGRRVPDWTEFDVAALQVIYGSLRRGEATVEEEFPRAAAAASGRVTKEQLTGAPTTSAASELDGSGPGGPSEAAEPQTSGSEGAAAPSEPAPRSGQPSTQKQRGEIHRLAGLLGVSTAEGEREEYLALLSDIACRPVTSANDLSKTEAGWVIDLWLKKVAAAPTPEPEPAPADGRSADELLAEVMRAAAARGFKNRKAVEDVLLETYAQPIEDLEPDQLQEFLANLAYGNVKAPQ